MWTRLLLVASTYLGASIGYAATVPVMLGGGEATLSRTGTVIVNLVLENGVVTSTTFTASEIMQGTTSKSVELVSPDVVRLCRYSWSFQPKNGDFKPSNVNLNEGDQPCHYDAEASAFVITPVTLVRKLTVTVGASAFEARNANKIIYLLQPKPLDGPAWTYSPSGGLITKVGESTLTEFFAFSQGSLSYLLSVRWLQSAGISIIDPDRQFSGDDYEVE